MFQTLTNKALLKPKKIDSIYQASAFILVVLKADCCTNSRLLEDNLTQRAAKRNVLDGYAYPEFRFDKAIYSTL